MGAGRCLAAVDLGTSACKTAIFAEDGTLLASATHSYPVHHPHAGWAEQDPDDWWRAAQEGLRECVGRLEEQGIAAGDIAGVGVDGQSWSCIPVDERGNVLARTPIWMDTRCGELCRRVEERVGAEEIFRVSGNPFEPSYTTPKILWLREGFPEIYGRTKRFLQSNSFLVYRLTGELTQDICQSYGLHVFDVRRLCYDGELAEKMGIDLTKLPVPMACDAVAGHVTPEAARLTGLPAGTPVVAGGLDAACGALGAGVFRPGETQEQGGQAGGMSICLDRPVAHRSLILSPHVVAGRWLLQGGTVGGGGSLRWLAQELGEPEARIERGGGKNRFALLDELAASVPPGSDGLVFLPYLSGERSPIWDPDATGVYFGLGYDKTRAHLFRALLEGAAFALRHNLDTAREAGVAVGAMHAVGGAANSRLWTQIKADVTGSRIRVPDSDAATARGAALLAGVGTGVYRDYAQAVERTVRFLREHEPVRRGEYEENYAIYRGLYPALRTLMARNAGNRKHRKGETK